jgi:hypothetical protein
MAETLVDCLAEKLVAAKAGCTCRAQCAEFEGQLPPGTLVLVDCVEHGMIRTRVAGLGWVRT